MAKDSDCGNVPGSECCFTRSYGAGKTGECGKPERQPRSFCSLRFLLLREEQLLFSFCCVVGAGTWEDLLPLHSCLQSGGGGRKGAEGQSCFLLQLLQLLQLHSARTAGWQEGRRTSHSPSLSHYHPKFSTLFLSSKPTARSFESASADCHDTWLSNWHVINLLLTVCYFFSECTMLFLSISCLSVCDLA